MDGDLLSALLTQVEMCCVFYNATTGKAPADPFLAELKDAVCAVYSRHAEATGQSTPQPSPAAAAEFGEAARRKPSLAPRKASLEPARRKPSLADVPGRRSSFSDRRSSFSEVPGRKSSLGDSQRRRRKSSMDTQQRKLSLEPASEGIALQDETSEEPDVKKSEALLLTSNLDNMEGLFFHDEQGKRRTPQHAKKAKLGGLRGSMNFKRINSRNLRKLNESVHSNLRTKSGRIIRHGSSGKLLQLTHQGSSNVSARTTSSALLQLAHQGGSNSSIVSVRPSPQTGHGRLGSPLGLSGEWTQEERTERQAALKESRNGSRRRFVFPSIRHTMFARRPSLIDTDTDTDSEQTKHTDADRSSQIPIPLSFGRRKAAGARRKSGLGSVDKGGSLPPRSAGAQSKSSKSSGYKNPMAEMMAQARHEADHALGSKHDKTSASANTHTTLSGSGVGSSTESGDADTSSMLPPVTSRANTTKANNKKVVPSSGPSDEGGMQLIDTATAASVVTTGSGRRGSGSIATRGPEGPSLFAQDGAILSPKSALASGPLGESSFVPPASATEKHENEEEVTKEVEREKEEEEKKEEEEEEAAAVERVSMMSKEEEGPMFWLQCLADWQRAFVVSPHSLALSSWRILVWALAICLALYVPPVLAFESTDTAYERTNRRIAQAAEMLVLLDVALALHFVGYYDADAQQLVFDRALIRRHFLSRRNFPANLIVVVGAVPLELIAAYEYQSERLGGAEYTSRLCCGGSYRWLRLIKLVNLLRVVFPFNSSVIEMEQQRKSVLTNSQQLARRFVPRVLSSLLTRIGNVRLPPSVRRLVLITAAFLCTIHLFVCAYWGLVRSEWSEELAMGVDVAAMEEVESQQNISGISISDSGNMGMGTDSLDTDASVSSKRFAASYNWLPPFEVYSTDHSTFSSQYLFAFNWVVLALLGNDLHPYTDVEAYFCAALLLLGLLLVSFTIGSLSSIVAEYDRIANKKREKIESVMTYLKHRDVPLTLQTKVVAYLEYLWTSGQSNYHQSLLSELPEILTLQLNVVLKRRLIDSASSLFSRLSPVATLAFVQSLRQTIALPQQVLVRQGERGSSLYFITRGHLSVVHDATVWDEETGSWASEWRRVASLTNGEYFGELALISGNPSSRTVVAMTFSELEEMNEADFQRLIDQYADIRALFDDRLEEYHARDATFKVVGSSGQEDGGHSDDGDGFDDDYESDRQSEDGHDVMGREVEDEEIEDGDGGGGGGAETALQTKTSTKLSSPSLSGPTSGSLHTAPNGAMRNAADTQGSASDGADSNSHSRGHSNGKRSVKMGNGNVKASSSMFVRNTSEQQSARERHSVHAKTTLLRSQHSKRRGSPTTDTIATAMSAAINFVHDSANTNSPSASPNSSVRVVQARDSNSPAAVGSPSKPRSKNAAAGRWKNTMKTVIKSNREAQLSQTDEGEQGQASGSGSGSGSGASVQQRKSVAPKLSKRSMAQTAQQRTLGGQDFEDLLQLQEEVAGGIGGLRTGSATNKAARKERETKAASRAATKWKKKTDKSRTQRKESLEFQEKQGEQKE